MAAAVLAPPNCDNPPACPGVPRLRVIVWGFAPGMPLTVIDRVPGDTSRPVPSKVMGVGGTVTVAPGTAAEAVYEFTPVLVNVTVSRCAPLWVSKIWMPVDSVAPTAMSRFRLPWYRTFRVGLPVAPAPNGTRMSLFPATWNPGTPGEPSPVVPVRCTRAPVAGSTR